MFFSLVFALMPLSLMAQDDMYFGSAKKQKSTYRSASSYEPVSPAPVYHTGSKRGVDEYNRRGSSYDVLPQDSDIIDFSAVEGVYPDSTADYSLTKKMARWEGYTPKQAYWEGYYDGSHDSWYWHSAGTTAGTTIPGTTTTTVGIGAIIPTIIILTMTVLTSAITTVAPATMAQAIPAR